MKEEITIKSVLRQLNDAVANLETLIEDNESQRDEAQEQAGMLECDIECCKEDLKEMEGDEKEELKEDLKGMRKECNRLAKLAERLENLGYALEELKDDIENAIDNFDENKKG